MRGNGSVRPLSLLIYTQFHFISLKTLQTYLFSSSSRSKNAHFFPVTRRGKWSLCGVSPPEIHSVYPNNRESLFMKRRVFPLRFSFNKPTLCWRLPEICASLQPLSLTVFDPGWQLSLTAAWLNQRSSHQNLWHQHGDPLTWIQSVPAADPPPPNKTPCILNYEPQKDVDLGGHNDNNNNNNNNRLLEEHCGPRGDISHKKHSIIATGDAFLAGCLVFWVLIRLALFFLISLQYFCTSCRIIYCIFVLFAIFPVFMSS